MICTFDDSARKRSEPGHQYKRCFILAACLVCFLLLQPDSSSAYFPLGASAASTTPDDGSSQYIVHHMQQSRSAYLQISKVGTHAAMTSSAKANEGEGRRPVLFTWRRKSLRLKAARPGEDMFQTVRECRRGEDYMALHGSIAQPISGVHVAIFWAQQRHCPLKTGCLDQT